MRVLVLRQVANIPPPALQGGSRDGLMATRNIASPGLGLRASEYCEFSKQETCIPDKASFDGKRWETERIEMLGYTEYGDGRGKSCLCARVSCGACAHVNTKTWHRESNKDQQVVYYSWCRCRIRAFFPVRAVLVMMKCCLPAQCRTRALPPVMHFSNIIACVLQTNSGCPDVSNNGTSKMSSTATDNDYAASHILVVGKGYSRSRRGYKYTRKQARPNAGLPPRAALAVRRVTRTPAAMCGQSAGRQDFPGGSSRLCPWSRKHAVARKPSA